MFWMRRASNLSLGSVFRPTKALGSETKRRQPTLLLCQSRPDHGSSGVIEFPEFMLVRLAARLHLEDTPIDWLLQCFDSQEKPSGMQRRQLQVAVKIEGHFQQRLVVSARRYLAHDVLAGSLLEPRRKTVHLATYRLLVERGAIEHSTKAIAPGASLADPQAVGIAHDFITNALPGLSAKAARRTEGHIVHQHPAEKPVLRPANCGVQRVAKP